MYEIERFVRKVKSGRKISGLYLINAVCSASAKQMGDKVRTLSGRRQGAGQCI